MGMIISALCLFTILVIAWLLLPSEQPMSESLHGEKGVMGAMPAYKSESRR